jgi:hypothetical protein
LLHVADAPETLAELFRVAEDGHRPPRSLWYLLILAALLVYFLDIVARKLPPAEQWLGRFAWYSRPGRGSSARRQGASALEGAGNAAAHDGGGKAVGASAAPSGELYVARLRGRPLSEGSGWPGRRQT